MAMLDAYLNATADHGASLITHLGLVDETGTELTGGTYARQAVSWTSSAAGLVRPTADETFDVPAATTVGGWRGYSALTAGTNYGGADLTNEAYTDAGTYVLEAASTAIDHDAA